MGQVDHADEARTRAIGFVLRLRGVASIMNSLCSSDM
jgi:hypothetical protein